MNNKSQKMDNQQLYNLSNSEIQLILSLYFGDGCFIKQNKTSNYEISTSCIFKESLEYKKSLLSTLKSSDIKQFVNKGYKLSQIYKWYIYQSPDISKLNFSSFEEKLNLLDELGLALWFNDDGSLHKNKYFYNLCTHSFSYEEQELIVKRLLDFNINGKILKEVKKDGRIFHYINISKYSGAYEISEIMKKIYIEPMKYKLWSSTTSQQWRTFQEEWKSKKSYDKSFEEFAKFKIFSKSRKGKKHKSKI